MTGLRGICLASVALLAAVGCSSANSDWNRAQNAGTIAAYQNFVNAHGNDPRVVQAREQIQKLQDEQAWLDAEKGNSAAAFEQYLESQPKGTHVAEARERVAELGRAAAWKVAEADGSEPALRQFLQKYAQGPEADQARAKLAALDRYRVELASFHSKRQAEKDRAKLQARYGKVVHGLAVVASSKALNNVESQPMSFGDAQSACATLHSEHQHCEILTR